MKVKKRTTKALKTEVSGLQRAYETIASNTAAPDETIAAMGLLLTTFRETKRRLTVELKTMVRNVIKLTAAGKATDEHRELVDLWRANTIELTAKITALEWGLFLHQEWAKVKPE